MTDSASVASSSPSKTWSDSRQGRIVIIVGMIALFVFVFWLAMKSRPLLAAQPALVVDEQFLSFGEVWEDPAFVWKLPIRNTTNQDVALSGFATSCSCGKIEPSALTIPAQGTAEVRLTLDLASKGSQMDGTKRDFTLQIVPLIRSAISQPRWILRGKIRGVLVSSADSIQFGETLVEGQSFSSRQVVIRALVPVKEINANCNSAMVRTHITRLPNRRDSFQLDVTFRESLKAGLCSCNISLEPVTADGQRLPPTILKVRAKVLEDVQLFPATVKFGSRTVGEIVEESVLLRSVSRTPISLEGVEVESKEVVIEPIHPMEADRQLFRITLRSTRPGHRSIALRFVVRKKSGEVINVPSDISYYGTSK